MGKLFSNLFLTVSLSTLLSASIAFANANQISKEYQTAIKNDPVVKASIAGLTEKYKVKECVWQSFDKIGDSQPWSFSASVNCRFDSPTLKGAELLFGGYPTGTQKRPDVEIQSIEILQWEE